MAKARITMVGAGLMGHCIAQNFARAGHNVTITDQAKASLDNVKSRILANLKYLGDDERGVERVTLVPALADAVKDADCVVEAVREDLPLVCEDLPLKQKNFAEIEKHVRPDTILASNTSVIPITEIMKGLRHRERALGTHWRNPPYMIPLMEVIQTQWTSPQVVECTMALHRDAGKKPAHVKKDVPGFIGNRLQHALWREAINLVEQGICDPKTIDDVVKPSFGRRSAVLGPLETPIWSAPIWRWRFTTFRFMTSAGGRKPRPILRSWWLMANSAASPVRTSANGVPTNRRCAPSCSITSRRRA